MFHYIYAGLTGLFACFPVVYLGLRVAVLGGELKDQLRPGPTPGARLVSIVLAAALILLGWAYTACVAVSGRHLARRRGYWFSFVVACLSVRLRSARHRARRLHPGRSAAALREGPFRRRRRRDGPRRACTHDDPPGDRYYAPE